MAIENIIGMLGVVGCAIIDTFLIIDLKMELGLEKRLCSNTIGYEEICQEFHRLEQEKRNMQPKMNV